MGIFSRKSGRIVGFDVAVPDGWYSLPLVDRDADWAQDTAEDLTEDGRAREQLRVQLAAIEEGIDEEEREHGEHLAAAVWVPAPDSGVVRGTLVADLVVQGEGEEMSPAGMRRVLETTEDAMVVRRELTDLELPAGPALLERAFVQYDEGVVENYAVFVFPAGADEAFELRVTTPSLEVGEVLENEVMVIADTITLEVG